MCRTWVLGCLLVVGCGEVLKVTPDAPVPDASPDALVCTALPDATFHYSPTTPGTVHTVAFTPVATGLSYAWAFPNGTPATSTDEMPSVMWSTGASNDVTLSVTDASHCTSMTMQTVRVTNCQPALASPFAFTQNTGGHPDSGIVIVPKIDTVLSQFTVMNQGMADTLKLLDANNAVLQSVAMPATMGPYTATVSWPVMANQTYRLVTELPSNNQYALTSGAYPVQNTTLTVPAGWMDNASQASFWFGYTNLVTCP